MLFSFLSSPTRRRHELRRSVRLNMESLEGREMPSATLAAPDFAAALTAPVQHQVAQVVPLQITNVVVQNGQLIAQGTLGSHAFSAPLTLSVVPDPGAAAAATTSILHLRLDPIHLSLLGLNVDTSPICLDITAQSGSGNLLGNLLSDVSGLLNQGASLSQILSGLGSDLNTLTTGLTGLLNGALGAATGPAAVSSATTNVLNLSLGPVDLNLLGLDVHLDNCANGPVTVSVTATPGAGNLLGNLVSNLAHLLDNGSPLAAITSRIDKISGQISHLVA
jgi:hypothetical protein